eukprot:5728834-Pyramimonas_sp.AAC.1
MPRADKTPGEAARPNHGKADQARGQPRTWAPIGAPSDPSEPTEPMPIGLPTCQAHSRAA